jgi:hypothetical protein
MATMKKAQWGERVGRAKGQKCGLEKAFRKEERMYEKENRRADRQADREAKREARRGPRMRNGGTAKKGGSFPDLTGDGKVTRADVLKGRGVIAKRGIKIKKAQTGADTAKIDWNNPYVKSATKSDTTGKRPSGLIMPSKKEMRKMPKYKPNKMMKKARGGATLSPSTSSVSKRLGSSKKLRGGGTLAPTKSSTSRRLSSAHTRKAMGGMKMGKCKYGC